jgi:hypothetical protein
VIPMTTPLAGSDNEPLGTYLKFWGRIQPLRWCADLDFSFLNSKRTLWTARDLFASVPNRGVCAHLGICFKSCGFSHRTVRGLIDWRTGKKLAQCTLWRTMRTPLPSRLKSDLHWREQYHKQILESDLVMSPMTVALMLASLHRDLHAEDPLAVDDTLRYLLARRHR